MNERLKEELRKYALISGYLFISFSVLLLYETSVKVASGSQFVPWTAALIKALVAGKFILIGDALSVGKRANHHPFLKRVFWKSLSLLLVLILFKGLEEIVVGWFHDKGVAQVWGEFQSLTGLEMIAPSLLMLLLLIPLVTASEIYQAVGEERFREFLLKK